ncbi:MAG: hypothetical protein WDA20_14075, partial [Desulfuromonadales bacterium]
MNRPLRQVFIAYAACVAVACIYVPWLAQPNIPAVAEAHRHYDLLWSRPRTVGYRHAVDTGRILLEVASLSVVLL